MSRFLNLNLLLAFVPISLVLELTHGPPLAIFVTACLAILPLAGLMGQATDELSKHLGSTIGGLLNATFGNAAELIITIFALRQGLLDVVKASIAGSIIGNILLVLGAAVFAGGLRYARQKFNRVAAGMHSSMLVLAVTGLIVPALFIHTHPGPLSPSAAWRAELLSLWVAGTLIVVYLAGLIFSLRTHQSFFTTGEELDPEPPHWPKRRSLIVLGLATVAVALESEFLVGSVDHVTRELGLSQMFIGIIIIPLIGNAAEHATAVTMAMRNKMDLSLQIAIGSSTQIALFVAPLLVFLSLLLGHPMDFLFNTFELVAIALAVAIASLISLDGETHWLEGLQLLAAYFIIAVAFFFVQV
jgi:Ca2+:H+ antiporter